MIELTEQQRQAIEQGELVRATLENQEILLLRSDIFRRIQAVVKVERAIIGAGHTRAPMELPEFFELVSVSAEDAASLRNVVCLPSSRHEELQELVVDDRVQTAWRGPASARMASSQDGRQIFG